MAFKSAVKTATNTATSAFADTEIMTGRTFASLRNLDDSVAMTANGQRMEPSEGLKFALSGLGTETIMVRSLGRALLYEIKEVA